MLLNATTRRDAAGSIVGVVGVGQDITAMKAAQVEKERAWAAKVWNTPHRSSFLLSSQVGKRPACPPLISQEAAWLEKQRLQAAQQKTALALERIADVIFELQVEDPSPIPNPNSRPNPRPLGSQVEEWTPRGVRACRLAHATPSFQALFGVECSAAPGFWPSLCIDADARARATHRALPHRTPPTRCAADPVHCAWHRR